MSSLAKALVVVVFCAATVTMVLTGHTHWAMFFAVATAVACL